MIKKVAIFGQTHSVNAEKEIKILLLALEKHNVVAIFEENFYNALKRSEEHTSELQSLAYLVCRLLLEKKNMIINFYLSYSVHRNHQ